MKKVTITIFIAVLVSAALSADFYTSMSQMKSGYEKFSDFFNKETTTETDTNNYIPLKNTSLTKKFIFNELNCDQELGNGVLDSCYSYSMKSSLAVAYTLDSRVVHKKNIEERGVWREDKRVPAKYRGTNEDYKRNRYDRGHLCFDSGFDYSKRTLQETYSLTLNSVPQVDTVNRELWKKVESWAKKMAIKYGRVDVIDVLFFSEYPKRTKPNGIAIADGFVKIIENKKQDYQECYYYSNDIHASTTDDLLSKHKVNCADVFKKIQHDR